MLFRSKLWMELFSIRIQRTFQLVSTHLFALNCNESFRIVVDEIRKKAFYRVTPDYSISMLHEWRKDCTNMRYLAEAKPDTAEYLNGLLRMHAVDEIIL